MKLLRKEKMRSLKSTLLQVLTIACVPCTIVAQAPRMHLSFSEGDLAVNKPLTNPEEAMYVVDLMRQQFCKGIKDRALDLSEDAIHRRPWVLDSLAVTQIDLTESFSVKIWVKSKQGAPQGTPIMGNKKHDSLSAARWLLYAQENGAWALNLSDGNKQYNYLPTRRQAINDGYWHQIAFSVARPKNEVRMYFDGEPVAIYNLEDLGDLSNRFRTVVGGSDEYFKWGSQGQWTAFNGYLDEVSIWTRVVQAQQVRDEWAEYFPRPLGADHEIAPQQLKVMTWNIWHGGRRYGRKVGVQRTIEVIRESQPDIVLMIETYGSGALIADALGYQLYLISSNLSIFSRYPIKETIEAFRPFNFGGTVIELAPGVEILALDTWLHSSPDYLKSVNDESLSADELITAESTSRASEIDSILSGIEPWLNRTDVKGIVMAGDFNSGSHLDWVPLTKPIHKDYVVEWPVSKSMTKAGFIDSYRELHINPLTDPGYTWTPRAATS